MLADPERQYCRDCLPKFKEQRTDKLARAARQVLEEMRASPDGPARSPEAIAQESGNKRRAKKSCARLEQNNPGPHDPDVFQLEILPTLQEGHAAADDASDWPNVELLLANLASELVAVQAPERPIVSPVAPWSARAAAPC